MAKLPSHKSIEHPRYFGNTVGHKYNPAAVGHKYNPATVGIKFNPISTNSKVVQSLKRLGMSDAGIRQLSASQPILSKNDQEIVAHVIFEALS